MAEHSEAPKNPQNPIEKSGSEYQPLWDMELPAPDYSALLLHGMPVAAPSVQAANFFPSADGYPVLNRPLYGRPSPTTCRMSPMGAGGGAATGASARQQVPTAFPAWLDEKVVGTPQPIGYIPAAPIAGKVSGSDMWRKAWPELIALFFIGVVFNPLTYIFLASITGVSGAGGYVLYFFLMITVASLGLPLGLWLGALTYTLYRINRKYQDLKQETMPLGPFWFYQVYDRLPKNAEEMQGILDATSSMSSVVAVLAPAPPSAPKHTDAS